MERTAHEETSALFRMRGGEHRDAQPAGAVNIWEKTKNIYTDILPGTRLHLSFILLTTVAQIVGLPAPLLFSLPVSFSPSHLLQIWRPFTSVSYLGVPSMSMANNLYFLLKFGQALEASTGSATHIWFLLTQTAMLSVLGKMNISQPCLSAPHLLFLFSGLLLGIPFQAKALVASVVYSWSRVNPLQPLNFQFGVKINAWHLPFCLALIDCLSVREGSCVVIWLFSRWCVPLALDSCNTDIALHSQKQSAAAAWPHVLGILTSHLFHFSRNIAPSLPTPSQSSFPSLLVRLFGTPHWLKKLLGNSSSQPASNVIDFRQSKVDSESGSHRDIKFRSKKPGHILGSSSPSK